jgi:hypothetical protein
LKSERSAELAGGTCQNLTIAPLTADRSFALLNLWCAAMALLQSRHSENGTGPELATTGIVRIHARGA